MSHSLDASAIIPILVDEASSAAVTEFLADVAAKPASTGLIVKFGDGGEQMVFVHHHPAEPPLPEMAALMGAGVYPAGVTPAGRTPRCAGRGRSATAVEPGPAPWEWGPDS